MSLRLSERIELGAFEQYFFHFCDFLWFICVKKQIWKKKTIFYPYIIIIFVKI